jgi:hypothetical protein
MLYVFAFPNNVKAKLSNKLGAFQPTYRNKK